ncbi:hypothetical protein EJ05DRAFT_510047 [Pseudovirgaria hyperparasitica]|uniref:Uncharacterized protein n=1 Tax=Pseudovirgaria hyperparasitica TaxID=470096 RepID=A0A6A6WDL8_9PEZI|nr:uncharacterized protein EJ05DRAFT_510047 [Pseudovirgaria hyperparasitica]KAF2759201.1 hypothetical protein EJ05DRAFT_510047 [Pseudovirgaria hyperparasitica]
MAVSTLTFRLLFADSLKFVADEPEKRKRKKRPRKRKNKTNCPNPGRKRRSRARMAAEAAANPPPPPKSAAAAVAFVAKTPRQEMRERYFAKLAAEAAVVAAAEGEEEDEEEDEEEEDEDEDDEDEEPVPKRRRIRLARRFPRWDPDDDDEWEIEEPIRHSSTYKPLGEWCLVFWRESGIKAVNSKGDQEQLKIKQKESRELAARLAAFGGHTWTGGVHTIEFSRSSHDGFDFDKQKGTLPNVTKETRKFFDTCKPRSVTVLIRSFDGLATCELPFESLLKRWGDKILDLVFQSGVVNEPLLSVPHMIGALGLYCIAPYSAAIFKAYFADRTGVRVGAVVRLLFEQLKVLGDSKQRDQTGTRNRNKLPAANDLWTG